MSIPDPDSRFYLDERQREWTFDRVFDPENDTQVVYNESVSPIVKQAIEGLSYIVRHYIRRFPIIVTYNLQLIKATMGRYSPTDKPALERRLQCEGQRPNRESFRSL